MTDLHIILEASRNSANPLPTKFVVSQGLLEVLNSRANPGKLRRKGEAPATDAERTGRTLDTPPARKESSRLPGLEAAPQGQPNGRVYVSSLVLATMPAGRRPRNPVMNRQGQGRLIQV